MNGKVNSSLLQSSGVEKGTGMDHCVLTMRERLRGNIYLGASERGIIILGGVNQECASLPAKTKLM